VKNLSGVRYFIQVTVARAYVRVVGAQRELSWLIGDTILPFLSVIGFVMVYRAMKAPPEYTGFVVLGGVMMTFWAHMLWSMAMQLFWEKEVGNLARYLMAPLPRAAILLGMALGGMFMTGSRALVIYISSRILFDLRFNIAEPWLAIWAFTLTMAALYGMGMLMCSVFFMAGRGANYALQSAFEPTMFLGGFYFPIGRLGVWVASAVAALIPTALGLDALRQTMFSARNIGLFKPETEIIVLLVMAVLFIALSVWGIRKMEDLGRLHGKLIVKEQ
jgi:ABC-2 type transport system permease protein